MAGVVLAETSIREEIEERVLSFRDVFAALFFFVFGLSIDVGALDSVGWLVALAVVLTVLAKLASGYGAGIVGGFSPRQSLNVGAALVAHGEFTIILAQHEYALEPGAEVTLRRILDGLRHGEESGNARFARTLFEQALNRQALRLTRDGDRSVDALDRDDVTMLTADDVAEAARALGEEPEPEPELSRWRRWFG